MQITFVSAQGKELVWKATGVPLSTAEVQTALAGNSLLGKSKSGTEAKFFFTEDMVAYRI